MNAPESPFLFAFTNPGAERALKGEVAAAGLGWRPSYQHRGFVTFKAPSEDRPFSLASLKEPIALARRLCLSLGRFPSREAAWERIQAAAAVAGTDPWIHELRWEGKRWERTDDPAGRPLPVPPEGQGIGTLVEAGPGEVWGGFHRHAEGLSPDPGGICGIALPGDAPSRAWLKLEEAVRFFGLRFSAEDVAVELGCAPGGVLLALLRRGVSAIGVDPARLAPVVLASSVAERPEGPGRPPWVYHCRKPAALVGRRDLGTRVTWFLSDMNQSPAVALKECGRFIGMCPAIGSALITVKLTDLGEVASGRAAWLQTMRGMGFQTVRLQLLSVHHQELALLGLDRR